MDPLATALAGGNGGYEGHLAAASLLKGGPHAASSKLAQDAALVETAIALVANRTHHHRRWCVDDGHCRFPQRCLLADRASALRQWDLDLQQALVSEGAAGYPVVFEESIEGAKKFRDGAGRHGQF